MFWVESIRVLRASKRLSTKKYLDSQWRIFVARPTRTVCTLAPQCAVNRVVCVWGLNNLISAPKPMLWFLPCRLSRRLRSVKRSKSASLSCITQVLLAERIVQNLHFIPSGTCLLNKPYKSAATATVTSVTTRRSPNA